MPMKSIRRLIGAICSSTRWGTFARRRGRETTPRRGSIGATGCARIPTLIPRSYRTSRVRRFCSIALSGDRRKTVAYILLMAFAVIAALLATLGIGTPFASPPGYRVHLGWLAVFLVILATLLSSVGAIGAK